MLICRLAAGLWRRKRYWMFPALLMLVLLGGMTMVSSGLVLASFRYRIL
jgi:hypothetical protein